MWLLVLVFFGLLLIWSAVLWLVLPIDIFQYSLPVIVAQHLLPPIAAMLLGWAIVAAIKKLREQRSEDNKNAQQQAREAERNKKKDAFIESLQIRRAALDCRWVYASHLPWSRGDRPTSSNGNIIFLFDNPKPDSLAQISVLADALVALYAKAPVTACLPIIFSGPINLASAEKETLIREARKIARERRELKPLPPLTPEFIELLPRNGSLHAQLLALFARNPAWPGAVVLAFDASTTPPKKNTSVFLTQEETPVSEEEKWRGRPAQALIALLITPAGLNAALAQLPSLQNTEALNALTPHWVREQIQSVMLNFLASLPLERRADFDKLPVIAKWHRSTQAQFFDATTQSERIAQLAQILRTAAIDAGLIEPPFEFDGEVEELPQPDVSARHCAWLVHNSGHITYGGERVAALGSALFQSGIEMDVIANGTNTVDAVGDCGEASPWLAQALAVQRAAAQSAPVLCAELQEGRFVQAATMNFVVPVAPSAPASAETA